MLYTIRRRAAVNLEHLPFLRISFLVVSMFQLHKKYPLYSRTPVSFYQDNKGHLVGLTPAIDPLAIFKKNSAFTKPLHEILDKPITPL
jgi:hypothetical protein